MNRPVSGTALGSRSAASWRCSRKCRIALSIGWWCLQLSNFRLKNGTMVVSICECLWKCFYIFFLFKQFFFSEKIFHNSWIINRGCHTVRGTETWSLKTFRWWNMEDFNSTSKSIFDFQYVNEGFQAVFSTRSGLHEICGVLYEVLRA